MDNICITTITHNNKEILIDTIFSFLNNTILPNNINWYILLQGYSSQYLERFNIIIDILQKNYSINIIPLLQINNLGLSKGFNLLVDHTKKYKYILHIEDDWITLPNINKKWLIDSITLLDNDSTISTILLRKYLDNTEKSKYGWNSTLHYNMFTQKNNFNYESKMKDSKTISINHTYFKNIPNCLFTLNPHIRRNKDYFSNKVIPLLEIDDIDIDNKHPNNWGYSEAYSMEKTYCLISYYLLDGIFSHYDDWFLSWNLVDFKNLLYKNNSLFREITNFKLLDKPIE